ncbi:MAG: rhomboid family intramembrane serine protease [Planctomycetota bacterium]|jgi:membrane associated rhomboid family serine protease
MFPYKDDNPTVLTPYVTIAIVVVASLVWVFVQHAGLEPGLSRSVCNLGAIPARLFGLPVEPIQTSQGPVLLCREASGGAWYTLITSVFLHGGWFHLIGNMLFLWVFGNNVEDSMGRGRFVVFYLLCGVLAALAQILMQRGSPVPMVGASGAISGVMGAYLILYPRVRVHVLVFLGIFITRVTVPAYVMLIYWAFLQAVGSLPTLAGSGFGGGVAFLAHLGGFVAGLALIKLFAKPELIAEHRARTTVQFPQRPW